MAWNADGNGAEADSASPSTSRHSSSSSSSSSRIRASISEVVEESAYGSAGYAPGQPQHGRRGRRCGLLRRRRLPLLTSLPQLALLLALVPALLHPPPLASWLLSPASDDGDASSARGAGVGRGEGGGGRQRGGGWGGSRPALLLASAQAAGSVLPAASATPITADVATAGAATAAATAASAAANATADVTSAATAAAAAAAGAGGSLPAVNMTQVTFNASLSPVGATYGDEVEEGEGEGDGASDGDGSGGATARSAAACAPGEGSYGGMVEFAKAACTKHEYMPGLFKMLTDAHSRQMGQSALGDRSRLLAALQRFRDGGNLTVAVVGGSIAAGQGAFDAPAFPYWMKLILEAQLPGGAARVRVNNGAVPGTSSAYMSTCHNVHVPPDADIVVLDYAVNDEEMPMPHMNNPVRRPFERLIRKLLKYPRRPAVVLMHAFRWFQLPPDNTGHFWISSERQHMEFGLYYGLQQLSVKSCCYHLMAQGKDGFGVKRPRADHNGRLQHENFIDAMLKGRAFYFDIVHPDGNTGHRVMGELAAQLILDAWAQVASGYNVSSDAHVRIQAPLPPPMLANNMESAADKCFIGPSFQQTVVHREGFEWVNEGKTAKLPKWGYVSEVPGHEIKFRINTNTSAARRAEVTLELGYLRSYENMGKAAVTCEAGCTCTPWFLDGHHEQRNSQTFLQGFKVSQSDECVVGVKVLQASSSTHHKVKLTGIMVSEDPDNAAFNNWAAWDWVSTASSKDPQGVFEIKNVARRSLLAAQQASSARLQQQYNELYGGSAAAGAESSGENWGGA